MISESTWKNINLSTNLFITYPPLSANPIYITASIGTLSEGQNIDTQVHYLSTSTL